MPKPNRNILLAMFDVRPKDKFGRVDFQKITDLSRQIDLSPVSAREDTDTHLTQSVDEPVQDTTPEIFVEFPPSGKLSQQLLKHAPIAYEKDLILRELEESIDENSDLDDLLFSVGGQVVKSESSARQNNQIVPRTDLLSPPMEQEEVQPKEDIEVNYVQAPAVVTPIPEVAISTKEVVPQDFKHVHKKVKHQRTPVAQEIEAWLTMYRHSDPVQVERLDKKKKLKAKRRTHWSRRILVAFSGLAIFFFMVMLFQRGELVVRRSLAESGDSAIFNLNRAKSELQEFEFSAAADSFALAYDDFNRASGTLDRLGASFISTFSGIPGLEKVRTASNLIEAGQNISEAGENLALAFATVKDINYLSYLHPANTLQRESISDIVKDFREVLIYADRNIKKTARLMSDINPEHLPEDKRNLLKEFDEKIPELQNYISGAIEYSDFILSFVGDDEPKKYLLLFQNNTELRPTGGFPGTYGLVTFDDGYLKKIFVDDIYNIDGQIKKNVIPPVQLQHITPNLGVRDAAWFADFPASARNVQEFYEYDGGGQVDGVITMTPHVVDRLLGIVGPIEMPQYGLSLTRENFLSEIQNEVEYVADRTYPKQIVVDFQPLFLEKLTESNQEQWIEIFKILLESIEERHILAYFNNPDIQEIVVENGLSGKILDADDDYLQVVFSNIKGFKTDAVTENRMDLDIVTQGDSLIHTLTIEREHNGGDARYKFYNRQNSSYVQVYVPEGSKIISTDGISKTNYKPLLDYDALGFIPDAEIKAIEDAATRPVLGVDEYHKFGKTVFGFWQNTEPQETSRVTIVYEVPRHNISKNIYSLLWQKQSGTIRDQIKFGLKVPNDKRVINMSSGLQGLGNTLILKSDLTIDRRIEIDFN